MSEGARFSDALTAARGDPRPRRSDLLDRLRDRGGRAVDLARSQRSRAGRSMRNRQLRTTVLAGLGIVAAGGILWFALSGDPPRPSVDFRADPQDRVDLPPLASTRVALGPAEPSGRTEPGSPAPPSEGGSGASIAVTLPPATTGPAAPVVGSPSPTGASAPPRRPAAGPSIPSPSSVRNSLATVSAGLVPAPVPDLLEASGEGPLPVRAADGRTPLEVYARPVQGPIDGPRLALVLADFGLSDRFSGTALDRLPADVTIALSRLSDDPADWATRARADGHEILVGVPMEPADYPLTDPGPDTLLTDLGPDENLRRLHRVLTVAPGAIGIVPVAGGAFTASEDALAPVIGDLAARGLMVLDTRAALDGRLPDVAGRAGMPVVRIDAVVGETLTPGAIDARLLALEAIARRDGAAIGWLEAKPIVIDRVLEFVGGLTDRGVTLSPLSSVVLRPPEGTMR